MHVGVNEDFVLWHGGHLGGVATATALGKLKVFLIITDLTGLKMK